MSLAGPNRKPALTAAASKIAFSRVYADTLKEEDWQVRAWGVYDKLPSVFYMTRYRSDIASKMDYYVGTVEDPSQDPEADDGAGAKVLENEGGPDLLRRIVSEFVVHWDIPGEGYLTRFEEAPYWRVLSTQELKKQGQGMFMWGDADNNLGSIDGDNVYRVWDSHPRFHWQADSPVRHILEEAEELILLSRAAKVQSMSQVSAGILILPDSIDLSPFAEDTEGTEDDVARWLIQVLAKPVSDAGSSASVVPAVMTMHGADIALVRHLTFERDWQVNLELRRELLAAVATGLDLPPEILTGMADLNHWSAWLVSEQAVNQHVLPSVDAILDSLTQNWFRPLLEASGVDPEGYVLWRDPSPATVPPDQTDVAARAYELGAISGEAYRRVINMDEEDAPTPEEVAARTPKPPSEDQPRNENGPPVRGSLEDDSPLPGAAVTAAVRQRIVATELADIDSDLLTWTQDQADKEIKRLINLAITSAVDPLDESNLEGFAKRLDRKIAQGQSAARSWLAGLLGRTPSTDGESVARSQGVQVIIGGVLEAIRQRLFTPNAAPDPIETGRIGNLTTPTEAIRQGLSLAGGGPAVYEDGKTAELVGNGQRVRDELAGDGFFAEGYVWKYGHPSRPFPAHQALNGTEFTTWETPELAVRFDDGWLRRSYYRPGDHKGCACAFVQRVVQRYEDAPIPEGFESCSAVFLNDDAVDSPMSSAACGRRAGTATDIKSWEETKPWEWTREQFDDTPGWELYDSDRPVLASNQGDRIRIYPKFFEQDVATKRYVLYHEAGHDVASSVIAEGSDHWKDVMRPFASSDNITFNSQYDVSFGGAKDSGFGQNLEETLADVYANLTFRGKDFQTSFMDWETPPWNDHARNLMDMIETHARKVDLPIHRPDHLK